MFLLPLPIIPSDVQIINYYYTALMIKHFGFHYSQSYYKILLEYIYIIRIFFVQQLNLDKLRKNVWSSTSN